MAKKNGALGTIGNVLWVLLGGLEWAIALFIEGALCCISIIGIPVGVQLFQLGMFVLWPFGKNVVDAHPTGFKAFVNVLWAITGGWMSALAFVLCGVFFCVTIIGIPFGKQYFKMARFVICPLGHAFG